jgi:hypothetical protein
MFRTVIFFYTLLNCRITDKQGDLKLTLQIFYHINMKYSQ